MPVEMVGGQVQPHTDVRTKLLRQLELKTAQLDNRDAGVAGFFHPRNQGRADIPGEKSRKLRRLENVSDQRRCGRLPVRAGDSNHPSAEKPARQFHLAPSDHAFCARCGQSRHVCRHARAGNNHILLEEGRFPVPSQFQTYARSAQLCDCVTDLSLATGFRRRNAGATLRAKKGCGNSRPRQPDHQHALACEFDSRFHDSAAQGSSCALLLLTDTG